ncbi:unnamed protein product [Rotaria sp. Silwood1]|nr:unnamed protein product [Rotaria sp. Silwood1]CAF5099223.1 unnamed protein product [Rotaria sp. Silwood1]
MLDTGATHSFITQRALSTLYHSAVPSSDRTAQLGDGHTVLKILGEVQLLLQFDRVFTPLKVLVVKTMNTDFILGSDWCTKNAARIDYHTDQVSICSKNGRIFIPCDRCIDYLTLDVRSINLLHIPSRESYTVQAKVELSSADTVYFSPVDVIQSEKSIVMSPSLLHINNYTTYLEVYNPHDYTYTLPTNTLLGRVTHTPYQAHSCLLFDPSSTSSSLSSQHHILNTIELEQTPSETSQTLDNLIAHITNVQDKQQLRFILQQHMKIFDTSNVTQANTHIQHTINTDSLDAYMTTSKLISQFHGKNIPIEMLNNMDSLYYRLNNYEESPSFELNKTETLYKENLREHFKYVDCVIHLGSMVHDRGQIYSASH